VARSKPNQWRWKIVDDVMVSLGTHGAMPDDEWKRCVTDLEVRPIKKWLVTVLGTFEVNSMQRKLGIDAINRRRVHLAVVSEDRVVRGLVTAASWFGVDVKPFPWTDLDQAIKHLQIGPPLYGHVFEAVQQLRTEASSG
jgi:hypothetical protein